MNNRLQRDAELQAALSVFPTPQPEYMRTAPASSFTRLLSTLQNMRERSRQRRELAELSEYALHDIGLSRADAIGELAKMPWR